MTYGPHLLLTLMSIVVNIFLFLYFIDERAENRHLHGELDRYRAALIRVRAAVTQASKL